MPRPIPEGGARHLLLNFRANDDETDLIDKAATAKGQKRSQWLRTVVMRAAKRAPVNTSPTKEKSR